MVIFQQVMLGGGQRPAPKAAAAAGGGGVASLGIPEKARNTGRRHRREMVGTFFSCPKQIYSTRVAWTTSKRTFFFEKKTAIFLM